MPRESSQKLKLLYVMRYLLRSSDEAHPVTVQQIIDFLSGEGIPAERKSIYDDLEALRRFGLQLSAVDEAAGVHHHHIAAGAVLLHRHA